MRIIKRKHNWTESNKNEKKWISICKCEFYSMAERPSDILLAFDYDFSTKFVSVLCSAVVCIYALVVILFVAIIYAYKRIFTPVNIVINIKIVNESVQLFFARSYHVWINNYIKIIIDFAIWLLQHENDTLDCNMRWAKGYTSLQNLSFKFYGHIKCCQ